MRSGADRVHALPPSPDQAARRLASGPRPARSSATRPVPAAASRSTPMASRTARRAAPGRPRCQVPPLAAKMPATPGRPQSPASSGTPAGAERGRGQPGQAAGLARRGRGQRARAGQRRPARPGAGAELEPPPLVSASRRPPGPAASASGTSARPGSPGRPATSCAPLSLAGRERREGQVLAGPEAGEQRPRRSAGDHQAAVVGHAGRGGQPPVACPPGGRTAPRSCSPGPPSRPSPRSPSRRRR